MKILGYDNHGNYWCKGPNGNLIKYEKNTKRKITQWKDVQRRRDRKRAKDHCEKCETKERLTIDHDPPLSVAPWESKPYTLCLKCHTKNGEKARYVIGDRPPHPNYPDRPSFKK